MGITIWDEAANINISYRFEIEGDEITLFATINNKLDEEQTYQFRAYNWDEKLLEKEPDIFWKKIAGKETDEISLTSKFDPTWDINSVFPKFKVRVFEKDRGEVGEAHIDLTLPEEEPPPVVEEPPIEPPEIPKTWLEKLIETAGETLSYIRTFLTSAILKTYLAVTGEELTEQEFDEMRISAVNFIVPVNALSRLFFGTNLEGKPEEFKPAADTFDIILSLPIFTTVKALGRTAAMVGKKYGDKAMLLLLEKANLKKLTSAQIEAILQSGKLVPVRMKDPLTGIVTEEMMPEGFQFIMNSIRGNELRWGKIIANTPDPARSTLLKAMNRMTDKTAYNFAVDFLKRKALVEGAKFPAWQKLINTFTGNPELKGLGWYVTGSMGIGTIMTWLASDNIITGTSFLISTLKENVEKGVITQEEALLAMDRVQGFKDKATKVVELSSSLNPLLWIWKPILLINAEQAQLKIDEERKAIEALEILPTGTLIIRQTPADAKIEVKGQFPTTTVFEEILPVGVYPYTISKFGYVGKTGEANVRKNITTTIDGEDATLREEISEVIPPEEVTGFLVIAAQDETGSKENITIEIAAYPDITTPGTYEVFPGNITVKANKDGFDPQTKTGFVKKNEYTLVSFLLEEEPRPPEIPKKATLFITSTPSDADVWIDGVYKWTQTPHTIVLEPDTYKLKVQKDGYYPLEATVVLGKGDEITVPFPLVEKPVEEEVPVEYVPWEPYYPGYVPPVAYIPIIGLTPSSQIPIPDYSLLDVGLVKLPEKPMIDAPKEKELLINIETTDAKPWKGRIFSIAWTDLSDPNGETQVIADDDEEGILKAFMEVFELGNYEKLVGFKLSFDYRFIHNKLMLYRMPSKKWLDIELKDVKQILDQVKEKFVYFPDRTGKLDDYGKELLGKGKLVPQETLLRRYLAGDLDFVEVFQLRQIKLTRDLYNLTRFVETGTVTSPISSIPAGVPGVLPVEDTGSHLNPTEKQCPNCKAFNPFNKTECVICGDKI